MITAEIAGYILADDSKCPDCTRDWVVYHLRKEGHGRFGFDASVTEDLLNMFAGLSDVDRDYADSDEFPVPFSGQQAQTDAARAALDGDNAPTCQCGVDFLGEF